VCALDALAEQAHNSGAASTVVTVRFGIDQEQTDHEQEEHAMAGLIRKSFDVPEEVRPFEAGAGKLELVNLDGGPVGRGIFEPGWQWSKHVKPIAGTDSCQASHMGYCVSGRMIVRMNDGEQKEFGPGDFMICPPGHDAWVVGDQQCVLIDWQGVADYAKR